MTGAGAVVGCSMKAGFNLSSDTVWCLPLQSNVKCDGTSKLEMGNRMDVKGACGSNPDGQKHQHVFVGQHEVLQ